MSTAMFEELSTWQRSTGTSVFVVPRRILITADTTPECVTILALVMRWVHVCEQGYYGWLISHTNTGHALVRLLPLSAVHFHFFDTCPRF